MHRLASTMLRCLLDDMLSHFRAHARASVLQTTPQLIRSVHTTQYTTAVDVFASCSWHGSLTIPREGEGLEELGSTLQLLQHVFKHEQIPKNCTIQ